MYSQTHISNSESPKPPNPKQSPPEKEADCQTPPISSCTPRSGLSPSSFPAWVSNGSFRIPPLEAVPLFFFLLGPFLTDNILYRLVRRAVPRRQMESSPALLWSHPPNLTFSYPNPLLYMYWPEAVQMEYITVVDMTNVIDVGVPTRLCYSWPVHQLDPHDGSCKIHGL